MKSTLLTLLLLISISSFGQKKILDHSDFDIWNVIQNDRISRDGEYVMYSLQKGETDSHLKIKDGADNLVFEHERSESGRFTFNSDFAIFNIKPWQYQVIEMKRSKVDKDDMPNDTLAIYNIRQKSLTKIPNVKSYKMPSKWGGYLAYTLAKSEVKGKKMSSKNGFHLIIRNLNSEQQDTLKYVTDYLFAKEGEKMAFITTGDEAYLKAGVYSFDLSKNKRNTVFTAIKSQYSQLTLSDSGEKLAFVADLDSSKVQVRPNALYHWKEGDNIAEQIVSPSSAPQGYRVSSDGNISFSKDETKLYFGLAIPPIIKDTTLIDEEIVNVEVWTYDEPTLYTVQELQVNSERKRSYEAVIHLNKNNKLVQIATTEYPNTDLGNEGNSENALISNPAPYQLESQWTGGSKEDYAIRNTTTGNIEPILKEIRGRINLSPNGKYVYGYDEIDSTWFTHSIGKGITAKFTQELPFYDEMHDSPDYPRSYGSPGWTKDDQSILIYDRYDIWEFNPNTGESIRITNGRASKIVYRYIKLDDEARFIDAKGKWLLSTFNEVNKHAGFYELNKANNRGSQIVSGPYSYSTPKKAQDNEHLVFTRSTFQEYPNLLYTDLSFKNPIQISDANPQQSEYNWGTSELVSWTSLDGIELSGILIKPENFDPNKKYPMIVNFYEKSADGVFNHRAPSAGRSTINYSFYTSRGYLIFNPDVHYRIGYPGESAFNCVIPGITALIDKGFVDKDNIGAQGHSWGAYQIAYLVTKTDIFKAAETGAVVANMVSAYGGIRWWSGLVRQFQYEHTQSRIGGTPWEYPTRYYDNSPIYNVDKINTPLLIMHNDADGHVPWYQGIEWFTALRRLGKPSWFLNYNDEPHWPLKLQNRKDFNIRMAQFFDHYLKGDPLPVWMERGVPAIEKGINQGLALTNKKD